MRGSGTGPMPNPGQRQPPRGPAGVSRSPAEVQAQSFEDGRNRRQALAAALDLVPVREDGRYLNEHLQPVGRGELVLDVAQELEAWLRTGER